MNTPKLIMLSGLPASGKSTRAKEIVQGAGGFVRVSKDNLRTMLHFDKWNEKNEKIVDDVQSKIVANLLHNKISVVIDDTNLSKKRQSQWEEMAMKHWVAFEHEHMSTPWNICVERDSNTDRSKSVGRDVIVQMAMQYGLYPTPEKGIILSDLDGTLCDTEWRIHHMKKSPKDRKAFHCGIPHDKPRENIKKMLTDYHNKGHEIVFMTGREETYINETREWLRENWGLPYITLIMRKEGDHRPDPPAKKELYERYLARFPMEAVLEDRPSVIKMWREVGLNVIDVGDGVDF